MKKLLLITLFFISNSINAKNLQYYYIDGTEIFDTTNNPKPPKFIMDNYFSDTKFFYNHSVIKSFYDNSNETGILAIVYKEFTNIPVFIIGNSPKKEDIQKTIKTFDYNKYIKNGDFEYKLKTYTKDEKLSKTDILKIFGKPKNEMITKEFSSLMYDYPNIIFSFKDDKLIDFLFIKPD